MKRGFRRWLHGLVPLRIKVAWCAFRGRSVLYRWSVCTGGSIAVSDIYGADAVLTARGRGMIIAECDFRAALAEREGRDA